jgi:hypothetical protein
MANERECLLGVPGLPGKAWHKPLGALRRNAAAYPAKYPTNAVPPRMPVFYASS